MNREIKFRFWLKNINEYVYWNKFKDILQDQLFDYFNSSNIIPEQFTGLLDKNGKEIYEGDIVNHGYENINGKFYEIGSVVFSTNDGAFEISFNSPYLKRLTRKMIIQYNVEVVGNIHDNQELLK